MNTEITATRSFRDAFDAGRSLTRAWGALKVAAPVLWVGGLLRACTRAGGGGRGSTDAADAGSFDLSWMQPEQLDPGIVALVAILVLAAFTLVIAFRAWLVGGWYRLHEEIFRTGEGSFGTLFTTFQPLPNLFLWTLLQGAIYLGVGTVFAVPVAGALWVSGGDPGPAMVAVIALSAVAAFFTFIYVALGLSLGDHLIALDGATPMQALRGSQALVAGHRLWLILFLFITVTVSVLLMLSGLVACCVGVLLTIPFGHAVLDLTLTEAYLVYTRGDEDLGRWALQVE